jgi:hypothetical protein
MVYSGVERKGGVGHKQTLTGGNSGRIRRFENITLLPHISLSCGKNIFG